jgi:hypothetical protein
MLALTEKSIRASILREVRKLAPAAKEIRHGWGFTVLDEEVHVEVRQDRRRNYAQSMMDRWRVAVGGWRNTTRWMAQKKDFDYAEIAANIVNRAKAEKIGRNNDARIKRKSAAFKKTAEYRILDALGVNMYSDITHHPGADILKKLSPAAFAELAKACGIE